MAKILFKLRTNNALAFLSMCFVSQLTTTIASATDEKISIEQFQSIVDPSNVQNINKRFQELRESASKSGETLAIKWPKSKTEQVDVEAELKKLNSTYDYEADWPEVELHLGAVSAVSFDKDGNVVIFHRVDRIWGPMTFDQENRFRDQKLGPIPESTVLALESSTGKIVYSWGKNLFYMPHGLSLDHEDNVWVTDVALHQVFKFGPKGSNDKPLMTLGTAFNPGVGKNKFCKPTSVAVVENGDFFVADGYCNARILKYSKNGDLILSWGQNSFSGASYEVAPKNYFAIPHALTLIPEKNLLCAADRENGRVQCFHWSNGTFHSQYHSPIIGNRLFSMAYTPAEGGELIIVNGPEDVYGNDKKHYMEVKGFVMNMESKKVLSKFGPHDMEFKNPHDVAVTKDGNFVYVAELNPTRIHKFVHKNLTSNFKQIPPSQTIYTRSEEVTATSTHSRPGGTAILVSSLMLLFTFVTFALAVFIARRRKRGCLPFGDKNRIHAWDKNDGFKLGGLLKDRSKHNGFERLDQDGSDEETTANTTLTTPFA